MKQNEFVKEFTSSTIGIGVVVYDLERSLDFYTRVIELIGPLE